MLGIIQQIMIMNHVSEVGHVPALAIVGNRWQALVGHCWELALAKLSDYIKPFVGNSVCFQSKRHYFTFSRHEADRTGSKKVSPSQ
jgi:hypothetical protein